MKALLFVGSTLRTRFRSGIQRVTVEIARALGGVTAVDFVKWDPIDAQLRYLDRPDLANLFGNSGPDTSLTLWLTVFTIVLGTPSRSRPILGCSYLK